MKPTIVRGAETLDVKVKGPLYCPYYNMDERLQGSIDYHRDQPFTHNPFTTPALGCSGSPVVYDEHTGCFLGFMNNRVIDGATFSYDGHDRLAAEVPDGQELFAVEGGDVDEAWRSYNAAVIESLDGYKVIDESAPRFWSGVEYCTWVEQGRTAFLRSTRREPQGRSTSRTTHEIGVGMRDVLNDAFVRDYIDRIEAFGYPKGKLTLDHGWGVGAGGTGYGTWRADEEKFPDFRATVEYIREKGFTPGLWLALPKIHPKSEAARRFPELVGPVFYKQKGREEAIHYLADRPSLRDYCHEVLERFHAMGFRKFKIDMSYNHKHEMVPIHKAAYEVAKELDPSIEMEFHVPDIFVMQYGDVIRTNDIWCTPYLPWRELTEERYRNCLRSAPGKIINLDHIGGNSHRYTTEAVFLEHLAMYEGRTGYPVVSLLPHHCGPQAVQRLGDYLWRYQEKHSAISDFLATSGNLPEGA